MPGPVRSSPRDSELEFSPVKGDPSPCQTPESLSLLVSGQVLGECGGTAPFLRAGGAPSTTQEELGHGGGQGASPMKVAGLSFPACTDAGEESRPCVHAVQVPGSRVLRPGPVPTIWERGLVPSLFLHFLQPPAGPRAGQNSGSQAGPDLSEPRFDEVCKMGTKNKKFTPSS